MPYPYGIATSFFCQTFSMEKTKKPRILAHMCKDTRLKLSSTTRTDGDNRLTSPTISATDSETKACRGLHPFPSLSIAKINRRKLDLLIRPLSMLFHWYSTPLILLLSCQRKTVSDNLRNYCSRSLNHHRYLSVRADAVSTDDFCNSFCKTHAISRNQASPCVYLVD